MTCRGTNVVETELAQIDLGQGLWRSDLARLRWQDPVDLNGLTKEEMGREDADLLGLTFEGEREGCVAGGGNVGLVYVKHGCVKSVVGDSVEYGQQRDGEDDEQDTGSEKETAVAKFPGEVFFLVRAAASANETDGLTGLVEASRSGCVRFDALSSRTSTEVLSGAVAVVRHFEGTQLPSRSCGMIKDERSNAVGKLRWYKGKGRRR